MRKKKLENAMYTKFVDAMLSLILEKGGLKEVNLRMVSKQVGCAHTNAYNYFENFDALIFAAYDSVLIHYGRAVSKDLDALQDANLLFIQFIDNIVSFATEYPGYYRFIGSDDFNIAQLPLKTIQKAFQMRTMFQDIFYLTVQQDIPRETSDAYANIIMAYMDGELYTIINKRAFPDEEIAERIIKNIKKLIELFVLDTGRVLSFESPKPLVSPVPKLAFLQDQSLEKEA